MPSTSQDAVLNTFALRWFRDTANRDYIHARLAYRARLVPQFQWSALHCLEKYAKGILLLNRIPAKKLRHEVSGALSLLAQAGKFQVVLSAEAVKFIERLEFGRSSDTSRSHIRITTTILFALISLSRSCEDTAKYLTGIFKRLRPKNLLAPMLARIQKAAEKSPRDTCIMSGWLEGVLKDTRHSARSALVWQNLYFGAKNRKTVKLHGYVEAGNSPLYMHPEILEEVLKYVYLPNRIIIVA